MKYKFFSGCLALMLGLPASGQAAAEFYVNDGVVLCPPQIPPQVDATNFVNNNLFSINFTNFTLNGKPYKTANTLNFTNTGMMIGNNGFEFDTGPVSAGQRRMAASFNNSGTISSGSGGNSNLFFNFFFFAPGLPKQIVSATNVVNSGTNIIGPNGLFSLTGKNVDLNRGNITMEGYDDTFNNLIFNPFFFFFLSSPGIFDAYWGVGTNLMNPFFEFEIAPPTTPPHLVTVAGGFGFAVRRLVLPNASFYVNDVFVGPTNRSVQAVFLSNTNSAINNNVYFNSLVNITNTFFFVGDIAVEWLGIQTNLVSLSNTTNYLYLFDDFGTGFSNRVGTNISLFIGQPTAIPFNYSFFRGGPLALGTPSPLDSPAGRFDNSTVTNEYAAYGAIFAPTTLLAGSLPGGGHITNLPGRVEITADGILNMTRTRINGLNYMALKATNHFAGSRGAKITVPLSDISLRSTNGSLVITNLLEPTVPRFNGEVDLWSGRWTNDAFGVRSEYHVLFVDSRLSPSSPAVIQDLTLRSTNTAGGSDSVVINDVLNVTRHLMIESQRLTVSSNQLPAPAPVGEINLLSSLTTWPASTPRLQYLTNAGNIHTFNAVFFGGSRTSPFYTSNFNEPYIAFVNRGTVTTEGSLIWANYFENTGLFTTGLGFGSIALQSQTARLTNGSFFALRGDISITSGDLTVTNHALQAGRALNFTVTNLLTDTGSSNANTWFSGGGVNVLAKPVSGDLLGTTILETASPVAENRHLWAAEDRGCSPAGFANNVALGQLILDGGADSLFTFTGTGISNALYVDYLDLRNFATNIDVFGNLELVQIDPNMKIYYAQAVAGGVSVAERLNGMNGGRFCWVSDYAGIYSSTNIVFPNGTTNIFNTALVQSKNLDSDCDGLVNAEDPIPIFLVTTASLPEATNNAAYSAQLQAGGGPPSPYTWTLALGSAALPNGLNLSPDGVIAGTPTQSGFFAFTVRASVTTPCGILTADRSLTINVSPGILALSVVIVSQPLPGALVSWPGIPNSTNSLYFKSSAQGSNWQLLTNFGVGGAVPARVSVFDPMAANATRFYRVQVSTQH